MLETLWHMAADHHDDGQTIHDEWHWQGPMEWMHGLRTYSITILKHTTASGTVFWSGDHISYKDIKLPGYAAECLLRVHQDVQHGRPLARPSQLLPPKFDKLSDLSP